MYKEKKRDKDIVPAMEKKKDKKNVGL